VSRRTVAAAGVALLALAAQACDRGVAAPPSSATSADVSLRASKLLAPGNGPGVTTWGTAGTEVGTGVARDSDGNVYVTGWLQGPPPSPSGPPTSGGLGVLIQKYGPAGLEWSRLWVDGVAPVPRAISVGPDGFIYVVAQAVAVTLPAKMFLLKVDPTTGEAVWIKVFGATVFDDVEGLTVDDAGNVIVVGVTNSAAFVMKVAPFGFPAWVQGFQRQNATFTGAYSVTVDAQGDIVVAGPTHHDGIQSNLAVKYTSLGEFIWASEWTAPSEVLNAGAVATDPQRNIYVASSDLLKLDPSGGFLWGKRDLTNHAQSVALAPGGQILVAGAAPFAGGPVAPGYFASRYDASGLLRSTRVLRGAGGNSEAPGLAVGPVGEAIVVGTGPNAAVSLEDQAIAGATTNVSPAEVSLQHPPLTFGVHALSFQDYAPPFPPLTPVSGVIDTGGGGPDLFVSVDAPSTSLTASLFWNGEQVTTNNLDLRIDGQNVSYQSDGSGGFVISNVAPGPRDLSVANATCGLQQPLLADLSVDAIPAAPASTTLDLTPHAGRLVAQLKVAGGWFDPPQSVTVGLSGPSTCPIIKTDFDGRLEALLPPGTYSAFVTTAVDKRIGYLSFEIRAGEVTDLGTVNFAPERVNLALNLTCTGLPTPLQSDHGWGGGSNVCELVDGRTFYETWSHALAFTGGHQSAAGGGPWGGEPAGVRHAVIDFGAPKSFDGVTLWWHGVEYTPDVGTLEVWNGTDWVPIAGVQRQYGTVHVEGANAGYADSDMYTFPAVTGSKVRYTFDNSGNNILGTFNIHGWLYEMEVWQAAGASLPPDGGAGTGGGDGPSGEGGTEAGPAGKPKGAPCLQTPECATPLTCTDGYCCDGACGNGDDNDCQACAAAKGADADGTCTLLKATHTCRDSSGDQCDLGAHCTGNAVACPPNSPNSNLTCYTRPPGNQCAAREASIKCGTNLTCPAPTNWQPGGCNAPDDMDLVTLKDSVNPAATVTVQFPTPWSGTISVKRATGCPPATGFTFAPGIDSAGNYWDLDAEPDLDCSFEVTVCVTYPQSWFGGTNASDVAPMESFLQLRHGTSAAQIDDHTCDPQRANWAYLPSTSVDPVNNQVCANTCSLSPFALMIPAGAEQLPTLQLPAAITVEATSAAGAAVTYAASAADLKDRTLAPTCLPASGSVFPRGKTTVNCTVTDSDHLTVTGTFTVTVSDTKGPIFANVPTSPIVAYAASTSGAKVTYKAPTATDAVTGPAAVKCLPASGGTFAPGKTTVTCNASDGGGHAAPPATFTVWVQYQAPADGTFFLPPLRPNGSSIFRVGRPVPVRFKLTGVSAGITNLQAKLVVTKLSNTIQGTAEDTSDETVDDTDFLFKYRSLLKWYAYRWKTSNQTQGTYRLEAVLGDGVTHQINVSIKGAK
jgi:hypothetical protein